MKDLSKMECYIIIDGESAANLFAAGPKDIHTFFLPEKLGVDPKDVKQIRFEAKDPDPERASQGYIITHKDNYYRNEVKVSCNTN